MTTPHWLRGCCALALGFALTAPAWAQRNPSGLPSPRLYQVSPAGAKAGTTVEVTVFGQHLEDPEKLVFSHPGIKAELVSATTTKPDPKAPPPRRGMGARAPADQQKYKVTVPADVPPGLLDLRVVGKWGVSNPRAFAVGDLPEADEKEPNNDVEQAQPESF